MSQETAHKTSRLCVAAAAVSAVGVFTVPVQMLPAAHAACEDWIIGPTAFELVQDNGFLVELYGWSGKSMTTTPGGKPAFAQYFPTAGGPKTEGPANGNINGRTINFTANWATGPGAGAVGTYTGTVDDNGVASGTSQGGGGSTAWHSTDKLKCNTAPAQKPPDQATPAKATVTVQQNSDVYDAAGGGGNRLGPDTYFLKPGRTLELVAPCSDDWCNLVIPDPEVPGGKGFVYAGIASGQNFLKLN